MKDVRIGNDISVIWSLYSYQKPFLLDGLKISVYLKGMYGKTKIEDYTIKGNKIHWTFFGKDQKHTGKYSLELVSNEGVEGMMTTDICDFVRLVSCSCKVGNGADECGVQTETIELTSTIDYVVGGGTISIEIDSELSEESTNPVENRVITGALKEVKEDIGGIQNKLEEADETFVNKSDLATINGQRIDQGGNIKIEGGGGSYDDTAIKEQLTELSAEVSNKQDTITDLETIRSGAAKGATALQSVPDTYATKTDVSDAIATAITTTLNEEV